MIKSFKHKGLRKFFETGDKSGIQPDHEQRLRLILAKMHTAHAIQGSQLSWIWLAPSSSQQRRPMVDDCKKELAHYLCI